MNQERRCARVRFKSSEERRSVAAVGWACTHFRREDPFPAPRGAFGGRVARVQSESAPVKEHAEQSKRLKNLLRNGD